MGADLEAGCSTRGDLLGLNPVAVKYEKAPIVEAVIEVQVEAEPAMDIATMRQKLEPVVSVEYPQIAESDHVHGHFTIQSASGPNSRIETSRVGYDFVSRDGKRIFRAHKNRFSFSRLGPYGTWADLKTEAQRLWEIYLTAVPMSRITRVGVRYINKLDFPPGELQFHDYLNTYPQVSGKAPDLVNGFFMRLELPQRDIDSFAVFILASAPSESGNVSMVLDIDVFKQADQVKQLIDPWADLELLRDRKNEYFESVITDKTRLLFGERTEY